MICISKQLKGICDTQQDEIYRLKEKLESTERERQYWEAVAEGWMDKYEAQRELANQLRYVQSYADREEKVHNLVSELASVFEIGRPMDR